MPNGIRLLQIGVRRLAGWRRSRSHDCFRMGVRGTIYGIRNTIAPRSGIANTPQLLSNDKNCLEVALYVPVHGSVIGLKEGSSVPKNGTLSGQTSPEAFQTALDALDVIGRWEWDAATDRVRVDAFVALLFNVDPEEAEKGLPLSFFVDGLHADDRERVLALIRNSARESSAYLTEYRVISVDGRTRWVLARGRFTSDHMGRPQIGSGILIDITQMRMSEGTFGAADSRSEDTTLDRAASHAIAAQEAIVELQDPSLKAYADALLMELGRRLARQEVRERRKRMN